MREWHDLSTMHFDNGCRGTFLTSAYLHDILGSTTQEILLPLPTITIYVHIGTYRLPGETIIGNLIFREIMYLIQFTYRMMCLIQWLL